MMQVLSVLTLLVWETLLPPHLEQQPAIMDAVFIFDFMKFGELFWLEVIELTPWALLLPDTTESVCKNFVKLTTDTSKA